VAGATAAEGSEPRLRADLRIDDASVRQPANNVLARRRPGMPPAGADSEQGSGAPCPTSEERRAD
jgi:hypothetical protein